MAMQQELAALEQNNTWILTSLPPGKRALTSKWVYKTKYTRMALLKDTKLGWLLGVLNKSKTRIISILFLLLLN